MDYTEMEKIAIDFIERNNVSINIEIDTKYKGIATFDPRSDILSINPIKIIEDAKFQNVQIEEALIIRLSHELGHYFDKDREELQSRINILIDEINSGKYTMEIENEILNINTTIETNAYLVGEKFVPSHLSEKYKKANQKNLEVTNINRLREVYALKYLNEEIELRNKIQELFNENKKIREQNIELMKENFELKFGRKLDIKE